MYIALVKPGPCRFQSASFVSCLCQIVIVLYFTFIQNADKITVKFSLYDLSGELVNERCFTPQSEDYKLYHSEPGSSLDQVNQWLIA